MNISQKDSASRLATRAIERPSVSRPLNASDSGVSRKGASRIPCPRPVAIGPSSCLPGAEPFVSYVAGLDKLIVSFWLKGEGFDEFRRRLQEFKNEFNDESLCGPEVSERAFDLGWDNVSFNMFRTGARKYSYKLKSGDIVLLFSNHRFNAPHPNCQLEIHSMSCWNPGWRTVFDRFLAMLDHLGCIVHKQNVTEYHIAVDLLDVDFTRTSLINHRKWVVRASKKISPTYEFFKPNYISFGKGDFMLRCYDKTSELKHDPVKEDFFRRVWYDVAGYVPEHVTRIEFQVRRAVSKELQINTVDDLKNGLDAIWQYCCGSLDGEQKGWARFCSRSISDKDRENKHHSRYATAFLWTFIQSVRFIESRTVPLKRIKLPPQVNIDQLEKMAAGCLMSICAVRGMHPDDLDGHKANSYNVITRLFEEKYRTDRNEYVRKIETKRNSSKNTLFDECYDDCFFTCDNFAKHDHPRHYYRTASVQ